MGKYLGKTYTKDQMATMLAYAISCGYPHRRGSKLYCSKVLNLNRRTLPKWYKKSNLVDIELLEMKIMDLKEILSHELESIVSEMEDKREKASYKDLTTAFGIMADKLILLEGGATSRSENISKSWKDLIDEARKDAYKPEMELKS